MGSVVHLEFVLHLHRKVRHYRRSLLVFGVIVGVSDRVSAEARLNPMPDPDRLKLTTNRRLSGR
jgi:hypothetical protein